MKRNKIHLAKSVNQLLERLLKVIKEIDQDALSVQMKADQLRLAKDKLKDAEVKHREKIQNMKDSIKNKQQSLLKAKNRQNKKRQIKSKTIAKPLNVG